MKVFFVGGASQARICYNILKKSGHEVPVIFDHTKGLQPPWDCDVFDDYFAIPERARACEGFLVCIGNHYGSARVRYSTLLRGLGLKPVSAIHPTAALGDDVRIGEGAQVMMRATVQDFTVVGDYCLLNINSSVSHEVIVGTGVHVMGAAAVCGLARIGDYSTIGSNATILPRVAVGRNCYVGAGSVVRENVPDNAVVAGVPARLIRYHDPDHPSPEHGLTAV